MTTAEPIRVLCVDDNVALIHAFEAVMATEQGIEFAGGVTRVDDVPAFLDRRDVDVILFDVHMPGGDVFEMIDRLSRTRPDFRVIVLSGVLAPDLASRAAAAGAWGCLSKGTAPEQIFASIREVYQGQFVLPAC